VYCSMDLLNGFSAMEMDVPHDQADTRWKNQGSESMTSISAHEYIYMYIYIIYSWIMLNLPFHRNNSPFSPRSIPVPLGRMWSA
jgi:uncharacterized membrane protein